MKKTIVAGLTLLIILSLCACDNGEAVQTAATEFVGPVAEEYNIDLECVGVELNELSTEKTKLYNFSFSSDKFADLDDYDKGQVILDMGELHTKDARSYMDTDSEGAQQLTEYLKDRWDCMDSNNCIIILSGGKEYRAIWGALVFDNDNKFDEMPIANSEIISDSDYAEYYLLAIDRDAKTCECLCECNQDLRSAKLKRELEKRDAEREGRSAPTGEKCAVCNGTGYVRYYYGESSLEAALAGEEDYTTGPCTSCGGTGYN